MTKAIIFQLLKNMIRLEAPTIATMLVSVKRQSLPKQENDGSDLLVVTLSIGYERENERRKSSR